MTSCDAPIRTSARRRSLRGQGIAGREAPCSSDVEDIGIAADVGWKRRVRPTHLDDPDRGEVEYFLAGGAVDDDGFDTAIGANADGQQQAAVEFLSARSLRIVAVADAFDFEPPVLDVACEAIFFGSRTDKAPLRALLVRVHVLGNLGF